MSVTASDYDVGTIQHVDVESNNASHAPNAVRSDLKSRHINMVTCSPCEVNGPQLT